MRYHNFTSSGSVWLLCLNKSLRILLIAAHTKVNETIDYISDKTKLIQSILIFRTCELLSYRCLRQVFGSTTHKHFPVRYGNIYRSKIDVSNFVEININDSVREREVWIHIFSPLEIAYKVSYTSSSSPPTVPLLGI